MGRLGFRQSILLFRRPGGLGRKSYPLGPRYGNMGWNDWDNVFISDAAVKAFQYMDESSTAYTDPRARLTFYGDVASGGDTDFCHTWH